MSDPKPNLRPDLGSTPNELDVVLGQLNQLMSGEDESALRGYFAERVASLTGTTEPMTYGFIAKRIEDRFIHPDSEVKRNALYQGFRVDDPNLYSTLADILRSKRADPTWAHVPTRQMVVYAVQETLGVYFGNQLSSANTETSNRQFYDDRYDIERGPEHLADFRGQSIAVCAEKSASAQNMMKVLGFESRLVMSPNCKLAEEGAEGGHAYNLVRTDKAQLLIDFTNPVVARSRDSRQVVHISPAISRLTAEQWDSLMRGEQVVVTHKEPLLDEDGKTIEWVISQRKYAGAAKSSQ
jgi:hypothetical protein